MKLRFTVGFWRQWTRQAFPLLFLSSLVAVLWLYNSPRAIGQYPPSPEIVSPDTATPTPVPSTPSVSPDQQPTSDFNAPIPGPEILSPPPSQPAADPAVTDPTGADPAVPERTSRKIPKKPTKQPAKNRKAKRPIVKKVSPFELTLKPLPTPLRPRQEIRGVWMTINDIEVLKDRTKLQSAVSDLRRLNFNTIYPVIWNSGYVTYPSKIAQQAGIQPFVYVGSEGHDIHADLVEQAHRQGLLVVPWFEFGLMAPQTSELVAKHPEWLTQQRDGSQTSVSGAGEVVWLNPFRPEVQQFITNLVVEAISQYHFDGIQFDDNMSLPREFGYDPYTIALYTKETKQAPPGPTDPNWMRWRANKLTLFMASLNRSVKAITPDAIFSVSPNYYDLAYKFQLQDWLTWVRLNVVDELIVQVYRPNLESFIGKISRPEIRETQKKISTGIGIFTGQRTNPVSMRQIQDQVRAAQERGLGVSFFYYQSLWDQAPEPSTERQSGFESLFSTPALRSAIPQ